MWVCGVTSSGSEVAVCGTDSGTDVFACRVCSMTGYLVGNTGGVCVAMSCLGGLVAMAVSVRGPPLCVALVCLSGAVVRPTIGRSQHCIQIS